MSNEKLEKAAKDLYFAGVWHCDRSVDEAALWIALRDALGLPPGASTEYFKKNPAPQGVFPQGIDESKVLNVPE